MKKQHRADRGLGGFEVHKRERGTGDARNGGRAWMFQRGGGDHFEPHYRKTARMAALPGKHIREVKEPVRSTHGRVS